MSETIKQNAQTNVYEAVKARGYREGWTAGEFAARQIMKGIEEIAELAEHVATRGQAVPDWLMAIRLAGKLARRAFDAERGENYLAGWGAAHEEAADVVVTMLSLAGCLDEDQPEGGFFADVVMTAESKATADVQRGVRAKN